MSSIPISSKDHSLDCDFGGNTNVSGTETESSATTGSNGDESGSIHTFESSVLEESPLRKVPPVMKTGYNIESPPMASTNSTPTGGDPMISSAPPPPGKATTEENTLEDHSDCSIFSGSINTFTSFDAQPKDIDKQILHSEAGVPIVSEKSSSLFSLGHHTGGNIEKLYTATSTHENLALHVRCGFAQRQNSRKYMEDCITVCPSFHASDVEKLSPLDKSKTCIEDDFSFFGVFDGHDGSYVSQYLQEHLMAYFHEKLLLNAVPTSIASSPNSKKSDVNHTPFNKDINTWRTSFLEAACKIDREILLQDSQRLQAISDQREAAFQGASTTKCLDKSSKGHSSQDSFAGSTAAVVIVYRDAPQHAIRRSSTSSAQAYSAHASTSAIASSPFTPPLPSVQETKEPANSPMNKVPPLPLPSDHEHEDTDNFHDDVVVGVFSKKDSAASVHVGGGAGVHSVAEDSKSQSSASSSYSHAVEDDDVIGVFPEHVGRSLRGRKKRAMQRFSSTDSTYDAPAMELNIDDENSLKELENVINKQALPLRKGIYIARDQPVPKRDSTNSNISDLTASYGNMSLINSAEDLLYQQHAQAFNPKRRGLAAAVKRSYEENSFEDFSGYEGFQLEELVDDFLQRASALDRAASDCRGQAAELLNVLQKRVSSSFNSNSDASNQSSASPYMSSIASNSLSAQSGRSMLIRSSDDLSDISPNSGHNSSKSYSSLGTISSLRSFDDDNRPVLKDKRSNLALLVTVTESLFESRATSFAASRQTSSISHVSGGNYSVFNENLRLALMGEIASKNVKLLIAHAGDCRVVLCDGGTAVQVTMDHTPLVEEEKSRIKASGGFVSNKRVNGILAVSRSFGDIKFKSFDKFLTVPDSALDEKKLPAGIWNNRNQVISMPEILELDVLSSYEFVIIASDCVWETLTCSEVIHFTRTQLLEHGDTMKAADALAVKVSEEGGMDNCSIIIINLNQI